jgi:hypothetical protein
VWRCSRPCSLWCFLHAPLETCSDSGTE